MDKQTYSVSLNKKMVEEVKKVQMNLAGCSNLSSIIEMLLTNWLQQFEVKE